MDYFKEILYRFKNLFDYNTDVARFIAGNGTLEDREIIKEVESLYVRLNPLNKEFGCLLKKRQ